MQETNIKVDQIPIFIKLDLYVDKTMQFEQYLNHGLNH